MTPAEEQALVDDWKAGKPLAGTALVRRYGGLVHSAVRRYRSDRCELDDLMQVGRMALLDSAIGFNPSLGSLSTWATKAIMWAARDYSRRCMYVVSISKQAHRRLAPHERPLPVWLDTPMPSGFETLVDCIAAEEIEESTLDAQEIVASLNKRERAVLLRLYSETPETLEDIGASMGVSKQSAWKLKQSGLARLRRATKEGCAA